MAKETAAGGRRLGDILVEWGVLSPQELQYYLAMQRQQEAGERRRLGQLLLEEDRVTEVVQLLSPQVPDMLQGSERDRLEKRTGDFVALGAPEQLRARRTRHAAAGATG